MQRFVIEKVLTDDRFIVYNETLTVEATNHGTALARAYRLVKPRIRRGTKKLTITVTRLKPVV